MSDDPHWGLLIKEALPNYAYPGEIPRLARIARLFIPPEEELDDPDALGEGIFGLIDALTEAAWPAESCLTLDLSRPDVGLQRWRTSTNVWAAPASPQRRMKASPTHPPGPPKVSPKRRMDRPDISSRTRTRGMLTRVVDFI